MTTRECLRIATVALASTFVVAILPELAAHAPTELAGAPLQAQGLEPPLRMTAFAVNMSNIGRGGGNSVQIDVDRWSLEAEQQQLVSTFLQKGPEALLTAVERTSRVGFIRLPTSLGYDLHYARKQALDDGGEQIVLVTDRLMGFAELRSQPRTVDYPFTLVDIRLNAQGEGEGKLSIATKISYNKKSNTVELENYASEPVRLQNVRAEAKK